jgi:hypothetical protein
MLFFSSLWLSSFLNNLSGICSFSFAGSVSVFKAGQVTIIHASFYRNKKGAICVRTIGSNSTLYQAIRDIRIYMKKA